MLKKMATTMTSAIAHLEEWNNNSRPNFDCPQSADGVQKKDAPSLSRGMMMLNRRTPKPARNVPMPLPENRVAPQLKMLLDLKRKRIRKETKFLQKRTQRKSWLQ